MAGLDQQGPGGLTQASLDEISGGLSIRPLAEALYVSPTGSDTNPGNRRNPLLTIQAAVNKVPSDGVSEGIIVLGQGQFTGDVLMTGKRIHLIGSGNGFPQHGTTLVGTDVQRAIVRVEDSASFSSRVTISGMRIRPTTGHAGVEGEITVGAGQVAQIQIRDVTFQALTGGVGVHIRGCNDTWIKNCLFHFCDNAVAKHINFQGTASGGVGFYDAWFNRVVTPTLVVLQTGAVVLGRDPSGFVNMTGA